MTVCDVCVTRQPKLSHNEVCDMKIHTIRADNPSQTKHRTAYRRVAPTFPRARGGHFV